MIVMNDFIYLIFGLIFILAGLIKGITGMGLPTVAISLLSIFLPVPLAAALMIVPALMTNIWQMYHGQSLKFIGKKLCAMMIFIFFITIISTLFFLNSNQIWTKFALGISLMIYAMYSLLSPSFVIPLHIEKFLSPFIGAITGLITGATGIFVIPVVPYLHALNLTQEQLMQALGLSFTISTLALAIGLSQQSALSFEQFLLSTFAIFPALIGMWFGQKIQAKISPRRFKQCFLLILCILGLEMSISSLIMPHSTELLTIAVPNSTSLVLAD